MHNTTNDTATATGNQVHTCELPPKRFCIVDDRTRNFWSYDDGRFYGMDTWTIDANDLGTKEYIQAQIASKPFLFVSCFAYDTWFDAEW